MKFLEELDKAFKKVEDSLPELSLEKFQEAQELLDKINNRKAKAIPEGVYTSNPLANSKSIHDLKDIMQITKNVLLPLKLQAELCSMKNIRNRIEAEQNAPTLLGHVDSKPPTTPRVEASNSVESGTAVNRPSPQLNLPSVDEEKEDQED